MKELNLIAEELQRIVDRSEDRFDTNCEGYKDLIIRSARYYLDAMFPSYCSHPETEGYGESIRAHC